MNNKIFICECGLIDHQLVISHFNDDDVDEDIYFQFHVEQTVGFFDKLMNFLPFIFKWQKYVDDSQYLIFTKKTETEIKNHLKQILED